MLRSTTGSDAEDYSDGLSCFTPAVDTGHAHSTRVTASARATTQVCSACSVNMILANAGRTISGRCYALEQTEHARLYITESVYRFKHRFDLVTMVLQLLRAAMLCKLRPGPILSAADNFHG